MMSDMEIYEFGSFSRFPKEGLTTPFEAMGIYVDLQRQVEGLTNYSKIDGREALYKSMVIREALTGKKTRDSK